MTRELNSPFLYLVCGGIILFVAVICVVFLVRAYRAGKAIGMDEGKLRRTIASSATFSILPAVGILLGVIALSGSLGTPWPWLRLSVIGALHYETQVAQGAAEQVGLAQLSASAMTPRAFATIALLMSICIMWGMILSVFFNKSYLGKISGENGRKKKSIRSVGAGENPEKTVETAETAGKLENPEKTVGTAETAGKPEKKAGFGDSAMVAMFIGLVSAYLGSYIGGFVSGNGLFSFSGDLTPILVVCVSALVMACFTYFAEKKHMVFLESFSIAGSMLIGMLAAVLFG